MQLHQVSVIYLLKNSVLVRDHFIHLFLGLLDSVEVLHEGVDQSVVLLDSLVDL